MSDINMNNQYTPQEPQYAAPVAPAAEKKKPVPTKLIGIAAAVVAAIILLALIFGGGVPGEVKEELEERIEDSYGYQIKGLDVEKKVSVDGAKLYYITGRLKGEVDDDEDYEAYEDYKSGYFVAIAVEYTEYDEIGIMEVELYEKDDKDDFKDDLKDFREDFDKEEAKETLEDLVEMKDALENGDFS